MALTATGPQISEESRSGEIETIEISQWNDQLAHMRKSGRVVSASKRTLPWAEVDHVAS